MKHKALSFDRIAKLYDPLASLVFGKSIKASQIYFFKEIPDHAKILIIGGGSGWIIPEIFKAAPHCQLTYIEASEKMLQMSRQQTGKYTGRIKFVLGTEKDIPAQAYDVLITNFLLDLFHERTLRQMMKLMSGALLEKGMWIFTDFTLTSKKKRHGWQRVLLAVMYGFFRLLSGIEGKRLPDYSKLFTEAGYEQERNQKFYFEMIESRVYKKRKNKG